MQKKNKQASTLTALSIISSIYGLVLIASATYSSGSISNIIVQCAAIIIGIVIMLILKALDFEILLELNKIIFIAYTALLILVLVIGTGRQETGTNGWISLGPVNIQPSEFAKIGFIITFSAHLNSVSDKINSFKNIALLILHLAVPLSLILLQPDYGTAMVFIFITIIMLFFAGLKLRYFVIAGCAFLASAPFIWMFLDEFQKNRILVFLNPELSPTGAGYNVIQSKLAVGSGMLFGKGLFKGTQIQMDFLPGKHTDFIFAVAGEELGFLGSLLIIALLSTIIFILVKNAADVKKKSGSYILAGIAAMLIFQSFENIGMCIGIMPVTGIPLPFFSYGGSSILTTFISIGVALSVLKRKDYI
ncbi:MAG: rod shape-determining protein RodA [Clostridia bacterium]|nr:rod shape-determining protein RodA [Clostridia bacterium]